LRRSTWQVVVGQNNSAVVGVPPGLEGIRTLIAIPGAVPALDRCVASDRHPTRILQHRVSAVDQVLPGEAGGPDSRSTAANLLRTVANDRIGNARSNV